MPISHQSSETLAYQSIVRCSPSSKSTLGLHPRPCSFVEESRKRRRAGDMLAPKNPCRGARCCESDCDPNEKKRPDLFCAGCKRERPHVNGWYHLACFFKRHKAELRE